MTIQKNIADNLVRYRTENKATLTECSEKLGISRSSLLIYLSGQSNPWVDTIEYLAEKLRITPAEFISEKQSISVQLQGVNECYELVKDIMEETEQVLKLMMDVQQKMNVLDKYMKNALQSEWSCVF